MAPGPRPPAGICSRAARSRHGADSDAVGVRQRRRMPDSPHCGGYDSGGRHSRRPHTLGQRARACRVALDCSAGRSPQYPDARDGRPGRTRYRSRGHRDHRARQPRTIGFVPIPADPSATGVLPVVRTALGDFCSAAPQAAGICTSLKAKLSAAADALGRGQRGAAAGTLRAFEQELASPAAGTLGSGVAAALKIDADQILRRL
jgi:hypothetical protein